MASSVNDWKNVPTLHRSQLSSWGIFLRISVNTQENVRPVIKILI